MYKIFIFLCQSEIEDGHHHSAKFRTIWKKNILELFLSETTEQVAIDSKLSWNASWMVLYKICVFCVNQKSKMASTTGQI